jgi:hypothetical protein
MTPEDGKQRTQEVEALKNLWSNLLPNVKVPSDSEFGYWLHLNDLSVVWRGIEKTARKNARTGFESDIHPLKYMSVVLGGMARRKSYIRGQNELRQQNRKEEMRELRHDPNRQDANGR